MNKRQSKKRGLQSQVDDLQTKLEKFRRNMNSNATIANKNQETTDDKFKNIGDNVVKIIDIQKDVGQDIQKQFKAVNLNSMLHSIAIVALTIGLVVLALKG